MKGIIFTELIEFLEGVFGLETIDNIIQSADLPSGGAYTAVGTYPVAEVLSILNGVETTTGMSVADQQRAFGIHLFGRLAIGHPEFLTSVETAFDLLGAIEHHIHVEVRKLYPDAELPSFEYGGRTDTQMTMVYRSRRPMADLCEGLIVGCCKHFEEAVSIERQDLHSDDGRTHVRFTITRNDDLMSPAG